MSDPRPPGPDEPLAPEDLALPNDFWESPLPADVVDPGDAASAGADEPAIDPVELDLPRSVDPGPPGPGDLSASSFWAEDDLVPDLVSDPPAPAPVPAADRLPVEADADGLDDGELSLSAFLFGDDGPDAVVAPPEGPRPGPSGDDLLLAPLWSPGADEPGTGFPDDLILPAAPVEEPGPKPVAVLPGPPEAPASSPPGRWDRWRASGQATRAKVAAVALVVGFAAMAGVLSRGDTGPAELLSGPTTVKPTTTRPAPTRGPVLAMPPVDATGMPGETSTTGAPAASADGGRPAAGTGRAGPGPAGVSAPAGAAAPAGPAAGPGPATGPSTAAVPAGRAPVPAPTAGPAPAPAGPAPAAVTQDPVADSPARQEEPDETVPRRPRPTVPPVPTTEPEPPPPAVPPADDRDPAGGTELPCFAEIPSGPLACPPSGSGS